MAELAAVTASSAMRRDRGLDRTPMIAAYQLLPALPAVTVFLSLPTIDMHRQSAGRPMQLWRYRWQQRYPCARSGRATTCRAAATATRPQQDLGRRSAQLRELVQDIASTAAQSGPRGLFRGLQVADAVSRITRCSFGSLREPDAVTRLEAEGPEQPSHAIAGSICAA